MKTNDLRHDLWVSVWQCTCNEKGVVACAVSSRTTAAEPVAPDAGPMRGTTCQSFLEEIGNEDFNAISVATGRHTDGTGGSADHFGLAVERGSEHQQFAAVGYEQQFASTQHNSGL